MSVPAASIPSASEFVLTASPVRQGLAAIAGPLAVGGVLAVHLGRIDPLLGLPLVILGVAAVTTPALYIATAVTGSAPPADAMAVAVGRALAVLGVALLGFVAPLIFLVATSGSRDTGIGLATVAVVVASLMGLAGLRRALFGGQALSLLRDGLFAGWALVSLVIALSLYTKLAIGGGS